jgi:hypothetical protein
MSLKQLQQAPHASSARKSLQSWNKDRSRLQNFHFPQAIKLPEGGNRNKKQGDCMLCRTTTTTRCKHVIFTSVLSKMDKICHVFNNFILSRIFLTAKFQLMALVVNLNVISTNNDIIVTIVVV